MKSFKIPAWGGWLIGSVILLIISLVAAGLIHSKKRVKESSPVCQTLESGGPIKSCVEPAPTVREERVEGSPDKNVVEKAISNISCGTVAFKWMGEGLTTVAR